MEWIYDRRKKYVNVLPEFTCVIHNLAPRKGGWRGGGGGGLGILNGKC